MWPIRKHLCICSSYTKYEHARYAVYAKYTKGHEKTHGYIFTRAAYTWFGLTPNPWAPGRSIQSHCFDTPQHRDNINICSPSASRVGIWFICLFLHQHTTRARTQNTQFGAGADNVTTSHLMTNCPSAYLRCIYIYILRSVAVRMRGLMIVSKKRPICQRFIRTHRRRRRNTPRCVRMVLDWHKTIPEPVTHFVVCIKYTR